MSTSTGEAIDSEITLHYSGGALNNRPENSLGGPRSSTVVPDDSQNNVWPDVSGPEAGSGRTQYRCLYIYNANTGSGLMSNMIMYISQDSQSQDDAIYIGLGKSGFGFTEIPVRNQVTPPVGITFTSPNSTTNALRVGTLPPGSSKAFWIKRVVKSNANPIQGNYYVLRIEAEAPIPSLLFSTPSAPAAAASLGSGGEGEESEVEPTSSGNTFDAGISDVIDPTKIEKADDGLGEHEL